MSVKSFLLTTYTLHMAIFNENYTDELLDCSSPVLADQIRFHFARQSVPTFLIQREDPVIVLVADVNGSFYLQTDKTYSVPAGSF